MEQGNSGKSADIPVAVDTYEQWVVVTAAGKQYIGKVCEDTHVNNKRGMALDPAYELNVMNIPVPVPGGGMSLQRSISCLPIGATSHQARIYVYPTDIMYLDGLHEDDRREYMKMVDAAVRIAENSRAAKSGISLATSMPSRGGRG